MSRRAWATGGPPSELHRLLLERAPYSASCPASLLQHGSLQSPVHVGDNGIQINSFIGLSSYWNIKCKCDIVLKQMPSRQVSICGSMFDVRIGTACSSGVRQCLLMSQIFIVVIGKMSRREVQAESYHTVLFPANSCACCVKRATGSPDRGVIDSIPKK